MSGYSARDLTDLAYARWVADQLLTSGPGVTVTVSDVRSSLDQALIDAWVDRETFGMDARSLDALPPAKPRPRGPRPERPPRRSAGQGRPGQ